MRTRRQLLKILRSNLLHLNGAGLCYINGVLRRLSIISDDECLLMKIYIRENRPNKHKNFSWKPGAIIPRYIWLTKQIWKLRHES